MKKYISTRILEANPISWGDFKKIYPIKTDNKAIIGRKDEQQGYAVKYENSNHLTWISKEIFEANCKPYNSEIDKLNYRLSLLEEYISASEIKMEEENISPVRFTVIAYLLKSLETCREITKELIRMSCHKNNIKGKYENRD